MTSSSATKSNPHSQEATFSTVRFQDFPVEIVRKIFEHAAFHRPTACILSRVSKAVSNWVAPILYFTAIIPYRHTVRSLTMEKSRAALTWSHTRNLFLSPHPSHRLSDVHSDDPRVWRNTFAIYPPLLSCTTALQSLVICNTDIHQYKLNFMSPALTRVTVLGPVSYMRFPTELFSTVKYLYLADDFPRDDCVEITSANLPKLTHLICTVRNRYIGPPDEEYYQSAICCVNVLVSKFETLRVVAIHLADAYRNPDVDVGISSLSAGLHAPLDGKILVKPAEVFDAKTWRDWVSGAEDVWARAERDLLNAEWDIVDETCLAVGESPSHDEFETRDLHARCVECYRLPQE